MVKNGDRRTEILLRAYEIAGKGGLEDVHARTVAKDVGINHAAVHYYYRTRRDLLVALAEYSLNRFLGDYERVTQNQPTAAKRLEAHVALYEAYCKPQSRFLRVLTALIDAGHHDPTLREAILPILHAQQRLLREDLTRGIQEGTVNVGSALVAGDTLLDTLMGLGLRMQAAGGADPKAEIDRILAEILRA